MRRTKHLFRIGAQFNHQQWGRTPVLHLASSSTSAFVSELLASSLLRSMRLIHNGSIDKDERPVYSDSNNVESILEQHETLDTSQTLPTPMISSDRQSFLKLAEDKAFEKVLLSLKEKGELGAEELGLLNSYAEGLTKKKHEDATQLVEYVKAFMDVACSHKLKPDTACNTLIKHCCRIGEIELSLGIVEQMKESRINLSAVTFEPIIKHLASTYLLWQAEDILAAMRSLGLHGTFMTFDALVRAYARSDNIEKAYNKIAEMDMAGLTLTASLYTPIIQAFGRKGCIRGALGVLRQMGLVEVIPTSETYAELLRVCASMKQSARAFKLLKQMKKHGIEPCADIISALVTLHIKCGDLDKAKQILLVEEHSGKIDMKAFSAMLWGLANNGDVEAAIGLFDYMKQCGIWPSLSAFDRLLSAVGLSGDLHLLFQLFEQFKKYIRWHSKVSRDHKMSLICVTIVASCIRHNQLGQVVKFLQQIQAEGAGDVGILCTKVFLHNVVKLTLEDKIMFVNAMWEHLHMRPSRLALEALLVSCARENDGDKACQIIDMMWKAKLQFNIFTLLIMFRAFVGARDKEKTEKVLMEVKKAMDENGSEDEDVKWLLSQILKPCCKKASAANTGENMTANMLDVQELGKKWWGEEF